MPLTPESRAPSGIYELALILMLAAPALVFVWVVGRIGASHPA